MQKITAPILRSAILISTLVLSALLVGCSKQTVAESDKALFVRAQELAPYGYEFKQTQQYEAFEKIKNLDGSYELTYEYDAPDSEKDSTLYLNETLMQELNVTDATAMQKTQRFGLLSGLKSRGITEKPIPKAKKYGDASSLTLLVSGAKPVGNCFSMRQGNQVYQIVISGLYFDDPQEWDELIQPKLKKLLNYTP